MRRPLDALFRPRSVAVVGASANPTKWGHIITRNVLANGFGGAVYPINPRGGEILGLTAYPSLSAVPEQVDLVFVGVSAGAVPQVVEEAAETGCGVAVVVTSGFGETGSEGRELEAQMTERARRGGLRIVGPNCMGVYTAAADLYATVGLDPLRRGSVALISQSGNVGVALFRLGIRMGLGFHSFIGIGNQADLGFHEYLEYLAEDDECEVVALYLEGLNDGAAFMDAVRRCTPSKPVVVLKGGRTRGGVAATRSHTGSLATDDRIFRGLLEQAGGIFVTSFEELIADCLVLSTAPRRPVDRLAILTDGGGFGVLAADRSEELGLTLAELSSETRDALAAHLPPYCSTANPVDIGGDADSDPSLFATCAEICLEAPEVDSLLISGVFGGYRVVFAEELDGLEVEAGKRIEEAARGSGKPVVVESLWAAEEAPALAPLRNGQVPVLESLELGLRGLATLRRYRRHVDRLAAGRSGRRAGPSTRLVDGPLDEAAVYRLLADYGVAVPPHAVVESAEAAVSAARRLGFPVVVKLLAADVPHKSEVGGVLLNLRTDEEVAAAFHEVGDGRRPALVAKQVDPGLEVIVGGFAHPDLGPLVMVGMGGLQVEALGEASFRGVPLAEQDAAELLREGMLGRLLDADRSAGRPDREALLHVVLAVARIMEDHPSVTELDLNPVIVFQRGLCVVDAKMRSGKEVAHHGRSGQR